MRAQNVNNRLLLPWEGDPLYWTTQGRSLLSPVAQHILIQWLDYALAVKGDVAEFGVFKGGTAALMKAFIQHRKAGRTLHLFDTFDGVPSHDESKDNYYRTGDWTGVDYGEVTAFLGVHKDQSCVVHRGDIVKTVNALPGPIAFVHVDCDLHDAVRAATEHVYPILSKGGVIVYDDYGWMDCSGAKLAVDNYYADKPDKPVYLGATSQAVLVKK